MRTLVFLLLVSNAVLADDAGLLRCRAIQESAARLACYDALVVPASPPAQPAPRAGAQPEPARTTEQFGLEDKRPAAALEAIESAIPGHFEGWRPKTRFRFANGQVWQVTDDSTARHEIDNPKVRVRRGALGAFYLEVEGTNKSPRVQRIQ